MLQQHEIIMMARQVGYTPFEALKWERTLTNFAKLVADVATAKEREACAVVCDELDMKDGVATWYSQAIRARGETTLRGEA